MLASLFFNLRALQFSVIIKPLFESFKGVVSSSSLEELHRTALCWLDEHCSLPVLRPSEWGCVGWTRAGLPKTQALLQVTRRQLGQGGEAEPEAPLQGGGQGLPEPLLNFLPPPCAPLIRSSSHLVSTYYLPGHVSGIFRYIFVFNSRSNEKSCGRV